ncbi:MAG: LicD family protein [Candidatus Izemoplasma sp.]|nr:LicD family protein [Candidatus Izemoplasma sp.]
MNYDAERLKSIQLSILIEFYNMCKKNDINIYLAYGTALGAFRHKGFIPWDDDIDVFILQKDRDKIIELFRKNKSSNLFYQSYETDKAYRYAVDRIRLSNTTLIENDTVNDDINHGVFIDVYPLFKCSNNKIKYYVQIASRFIYRLFVYRKVPKNKNFIVKTICKVLLLYPKKLKRKFINNNYTYTNNLGDDNFFSTFYGDEVKHKYPSEWFKTITLLDFEDDLFPVPSDIEKYLKLDYGSNYKDLPPIEKRLTNHNYFFVDLDKKYSEYKYHKYMEKLK